MFMDRIIETVRGRERERERASERGAERKAERGKLREMGGGER